MIKLKIVLLLISLLAIRIAWFYSKSFVPVLEGIVTSVPKTIGAQQRFNIEGYPVVIYGALPVHYGDKVLINKGNLSLLKESRVRPYFKLVDIIRSKVISIYHNVLPKPEADLLSGIVLGGGNLDRGFKAKLASVGLTHVVAASGMNVTFVYGATVWFLNRFLFSKYFKIFLSSLVILFYSTLTGFDPPIVRASLMAVFVLIASFIGRQSKGWIGLGISAYIMLWVSPNLIVNPSFLLSFTSMMGQIFLSTIKVELPIFIASILEIFLQSFVAIVFTLPIVLIFFSNFSPISLFTNVLTIWTVEPLMILGGLIATLGVFFTPFAQALSLPAQGLLEYFLWVVNFFEKNNFFKIYL